MSAKSLTERVQAMIDQAKSDIHTTGRNGAAARQSGWLTPAAAKAKREEARRILVALDPPRFAVGDTFHDWLLGNVVVACVWPTTPGAAGSQYIVYKADADPYYHATYLSNDGMAKAPATP